jgi:hypothetical protein
LHSLKNGDLLADYTGENRIDKSSGMFDTQMPGFAKVTYFL